MINGQSHTNYSLEDIEKYLQGKMSAADMHELEKAALQDTFLSDAIEGYKGTSMQTAYKHLEEIRRELTAGKKEIKVVPLYSFRSVKWWQIAAALFMIATVTTITWKITNQDKKQGYIAVSPKSGIAKKDSTTALIIANNTNRNKENAAVTGKSNQSSPKTTTNKNLINITSDKNIQPDTNFKEQLIASAPRYTQDTIIPIPSALSKDMDKNVIAFNKRGIQSPNINNQDLVALEGKLAGVAISKNKAKQTSRDILIRGKASNNSRKPIYVLDGEIYDSLPTALSPSRIKKIDILKDTNAVALYGAKAANGAIVISSNLKNNLIKGKIVNQKGEGIAGASVNINRNQLNLITDTKGNFAVNSFDSTAIVSVNSIGYEPAQSVINAGRLNNIELKSNQYSLEEVVVVGYGTKKKARVTGAVSSINPGRKNKQGGILSGNNIIPSAQQKSDTLKPDGGWGNFKAYMADKLSKEANAPIHGTIEFEFTVNNKQKPTNIIILQSPDNNKNKQIIKAIKSGSKWIVVDKNKKYKVIISL